MKRIYLGLVLFLFGFIGVASLWFVEIPMDSIPQAISPAALKVFVLIQSSVFLLISTGIGLCTFNKVGLKVPIIGYLVGLYEEKYNWKEIFINGVAYGSMAGILILLVSHIFKLVQPTEFAALNQEMELHFLTKILYGGITEEVLTRFGLMSLLTYLFSFIYKRHAAVKYWIGIGICSLLFGIGHLPMAYQVLGEPSLSIIIYIVFGNFLGGILFGWLYWKRGLESAMIGHMSAHILMLSLEKLITLASS